MSIITLPSGIYFGSFAVSQRRFDTKEMSDTTGDARDRLLARGHLIAGVVRQHTRHVLGAGLP